MHHDDEDEGLEVEGRASKPARLRVPLRNMDEIAKELARLYREMKGGTIATQDGSRMSNVLQILARVIEGGQLEQRLAALEEADKRRWVQ